MRNTTVPNFKVPGRKKPSGRMWITIILCVILPPVGLIMLWGRTRCPIRGKVLMTVVSVAAMVGIIAFALNWGATDERQSIYGSVEATPALVIPTPASQADGATGEVVPAPEAASDTGVNAGGDAAQTAADTDDANAIIPANPVA
ncbi:MAG: hypothetical protein Q4D04_04910 [Clostridia bacterium]|nr:hypothetical protein [Clostridia bacterium]